MENIVKGWFTSLLGAALMILSIVEWWSKEEAQMTDYNVIGPFVGGFALLWMRDNISQWISTFIQAAIDKFKSK